MKIRLRTVLAVVASATLCSLAHSQDGDFYGLLRSRDLTPFGFLRLDMRPAHAVSIEKGAWATEFEFAYQNTWALSKEVETYLKTLESQGRRDLGESEVQAIRELPGENYLLDVESAALDLTLHYKFAEEWSGYLIISAVSYQGGFLDSTIEQFHKTAGFSTFGRRALSRNDVNLVYDLKSVQLTSLGSPTDGGLTDPTIGVRFNGTHLPQPWNLAIEAAVKVPVAGERRLLSSGKYDFGIQASLQRRGKRHALYSDVAAVYYGGIEWPVPQDSQVIPTVILGYEYLLTERTNLNVQAYLSTSVYSRDQTDLDELTGTKYQYSLGFRHRFDRFLLTCGITENVQNVNNTPDIGFQLGLAFIPRPAR